MLHPKSSLGTGPKIPPNPAVPPNNIQALIEKIAMDVAVRGPAYEIQIRSRDEALSFLHLDNVYAPFYQWKLAEARSQCLRNPMLETKSNPGLTTISPNCISTPVPPEMPELAGGDEMPLSDLFSLFDFTYGENASDEHARIEDFNNVPNGGENLEPEQHDNFFEQHHTIPCPQQTILATSQVSSPPFRKPPSKAACFDPLCHGTVHRRVSAPPAVYTQLTHVQTDPDRSRYAVDREVHLLDSNGTERSGLSTYIIISNSEGPCAADIHVPQDPEKHANGFGMDTPHTRQHGQNTEHIYRLRPATSAIFRTTHSRLLPVGFNLGAEVKRAGIDGANIIIRRTVENGARLYDLKDESGNTHLGIAEDELALHLGARFAFRMPQHLPLLRTQL